MMRSGETFLPILCDVTYFLYVHILVKVLNLDKDINPATFAKKLTPYKQKTVLQKQNG